jgi:Tol biopolymer transport system component
MAGTEVQNLYDMTFVLQDHRPGETIDLLVERDDATLTLRATLGTRSKKAAAPHGGSSLGPGPGWTPTAGRDASHLLDEREVHLADLRQLTFGGENAEAYWSPDGRKLVFQRTPPEGGCDQQFVLDLDTGDVVRWSSGKGRTTCGYFAYPGGERLLYATTEGAGAPCPPTPDQSQGYVWPLYEGYELVWQAAPDAAPEPFLASPGYDAEATLCMRDGRVVFTSTRSGDLELWVADADGSNLRQLTDQPGYDGGAFFTPDCERIVWRASRPVAAELEDYRRLLGQGLVRPGKLEIFSMKADGSDVLQLTTAGAASFGPYPSPDDGVIFSSNLGTSPREFDLYRVPMEGGEPEQITFTEQFDGFPMFSPDGRWLVWGSNRGGQNRETNLFLARWVR